MASETNDPTQRVPPTQGDTPPPSLQSAERTGGGFAAGGFPNDVHRALPHSIEAEKGVISSMLRSPNQAIGEAMEKLKTEYFYIPAHQTLYDVIVGLKDTGRPVDPISVNSELLDKKLMDQVGGPAAVTDIYGFAPVASHLDYYLDIVDRKHTLREVIQSCSDSIQLAYDRQDSVETVLDDVEQAILAIRNEKDRTNKVGTMKQHIEEAIDEIERIASNPGQLTGITSGYPNMDEMTNGLHGGEMFIIAARPSMGKTSLVMNIVEQVSVDHGIPSAVFSLEMSAKQLVLRLLCSRARLSMKSLQTGFMKQGEIQGLARAAQDLGKANIIIDDTPSISILELKAKARRFKDQHGIGLIAIDYLQLMRSTSKRAQDSRQLEIAEISSGVKALSKELDIPIIVLAQLNRNPEARSGGRPMLSDLRESGSIEQDADIVGLLVRPDYYDKGEEEGENEMEEPTDPNEGLATLIIAKQRNGPTGDLNFKFLKEYMRFIPTEGNAFGE